MEQFYSVRQVVHFAIALERASRQFYHRLAAEAAEPPVRTYLLKLADEETLHENALRHAIDSAGDDPLSATVSQKEVVAYIQAAKLPDSLDYKSAVRLARDKENASRMLYSVLARVTDNPILENLFLYLEQQETEHQLYFEREYARISIGQN
jgi:rubrerythrin